MTFVWTLLFAVAVLIIGSMAWRFFSLRTKGFPVVVRTLPCEEGRHWRHGVLIYTARSVRIFKLRSLRPEPDFYMTRLHTEILGRRAIKDNERHVLEDDTHVVEIKHDSDHLELALSQPADTALVAWLESRPSERRVN